MTDTRTEKENGLTNDPTKDLSLEEIQRALLEILAAFDGFCSENGLQYFLSGGTLLGAVRHQGFIPWDDDVDVMMPRPDYDRLFALTEAAGGDLSGPFRLIGYQNRRSSIPFAKVIDRRVRVEEEINGIDRYLWIDVFPLDAVPEDRAAAEKLLKKAHRLKYRYALSTAPLGTGTSRWRAALKLPAVFAAKTLPALFGKGYYARKIAALCDPGAYGDSAYIASLSWCCGPEERMKKSDLYPAERIPFDGLTLSVSHEREAYLRRMYGDYQTLPDEKDRNGHRYHAYYVRRKEHEKV